jgi:predicted permease
MDTIWQDLRYGLRMLMKNPGFAAVAVVTLALGIGANTAIFSVVNAALLRPLPYPEAEQLMHIGVSLRETPFAAANQLKFLFWREHSRSFEAMAARGVVIGFNLSGGNEPEYVSGMKVSGDFFRVFGARPALGRSFTADEDRPGGSRVAVLTDSLWRRRFGGNPGLIGQTITLNSEPYIVIGVLPQGFTVMPEADVLLPLQASPTSSPGDYNYSVVGKLKRNVTTEQALAGMKLVAEQYRAAFPERMMEGESVNLEPYQEGLVREVRPALLVLFGAIGFVLLIACANVANLQLVRASARQREMAVRMALGASRRRVARQLLTEGVLLSVAGGAAGLLLAAWGTEALVRLMPDGLIPRASEIAFDWRVLGFTLVSSMATGLIFALAPAVQAGRVDVNHSLKEASSQGIVGARRGRLRGALVIAEIASSLVLLVGAALLIRTFVGLQRVEPGFESRNVLSFKVRLSGERYATAAQTAEFQRRVLERLRGLPGVESAAVTSNLPMDQPFRMPTWIAGRTDSVGSIQFRAVSPDYFRLLKISLKRGREFSDTDKLGAGPVAIVNEAFARQHLSSVDPLGQPLSIGGALGSDSGNRASRQIVGVVGDVKQFGLRAPAPAMVFVPAAQVDDGLLRVLRRFLPTTFVVRTTVEPLSLSNAAKQAVLAEDPQLALADVRSLEQLLGRSVASERFYMLLLSIFAGLGLVLAAVGVYGLMSYSVAERTNEIGLRLALGASAGVVLGMVIRQGMTLALTGVVVGLGAALGLTQGMKSLLFGVSTTDPLTFVGVTLILALAALAACYLPARRASQVDPMVALRYE